MNNLVVEGTSITFTKKGEGKKPIQTHITNERKIGTGIYGDIYEANVTVGKKSKKFVIKKFKDTKINDVESTAQENATKAATNYQTAKSAGLKVFTTYRLADDGTSILMTNGNTESTILVGNKALSQLPDMGEPKIEKIEEEAFEELVSGVFDQAILATDHNVTIHGDAFFFLVDRPTRGVDFVIGDLDNVDQRPIFFPQSQFLTNLSHARSALVAFLLGNVEDPDRYGEPLSRIYTAIKINEGYGNF